MDSSLHEVWQAAAGSPFVPLVGKGSQFLVAFFLLLLGLSLGTAFALSTLPIFMEMKMYMLMLVIRPFAPEPARPGLPGISSPCVRSSQAFAQCWIVSDLGLDLVWCTCFALLEFTSRYPRSRVCIIGVRV
jgi:hypothetical protein